MKRVTRDEFDKAVKTINDYAEMMNELYDSLSFPKEKYFNKLVVDEDISVRTLNVLRSCLFEHAVRVSKLTIIQLSFIKKNRLIKERGCGRKTILELETILGKYGLKFS